MTKSQRDVFICHASKDKNEIVQLIVDGLKKVGISYWYDDNDIQWGDSIIKNINRGLRISRYVLVVLSSNFILRHWTWRELNAALYIESSSGVNRILPLLVGTEKEKKRLMNKNPFLSDKKYLQWNNNTNEIVRELRACLSKSAIIRHPNIQQKITNEIPIAGRKNEIKLFKKVLNKVNVKVDIFWIYGPSGFGKTELMSHLCSIARNNTFECAQDIIGNEDISPVFRRMLRIQSSASQFPDREDSNYRILADSLNELKVRNANIVIAIDTAKEFNDYQGLLEFIRNLINRLRDLKKRTILIIATQKKPFSLPIGTCNQLRGFTAKEVHELIKIQGWDKRLLEYSELLEKKTGGSPWVLSELCRFVTSESVLDIQDYINNTNDSNIHTNWRENLSGKEKTIMSLLSIISEVTPSSP